MNHCTLESPSRGEIAASHPIDLSLALTAIRCRDPKVWAWLDRLSARLGQPITSAEDVPHEWLLKLQSHLESRPPLADPAAVRKCLSRETQAGLTYAFVDAEQGRITLEWLGGPQLPCEALEDWCWQAVNTLLDLAEECAIAQQQGRVAA